MKSAITVSLVPQAAGGPFVFWNGLADAFTQAQALGFDAVEVFPPAANAIDIAELQGLLDHYELKLAAMGTGGGWVMHRWSLTHPDAAIRHNAREFIRAVVDLAEGFGAPAIVGSLQGRWEGEVSREQALAWLAEALEDLGEHAASHGQVLLYEALNRYESNLFNRQGEAAAWVRSLKTKGVRLLCDLYHMNIEESDLAGALRECGGLVGHVHFADSNRRAIGFGHTHMEPIIAALRDIGFQGYLSAEVLPLPDPTRAAAQTIESFRRLTQPA
ncbi:MAG TPA: sugar phosphate isomerase/epimerase family protein [Chthoniobacteraceae bacterium]|nr:sugar phosphate isomerase/epimerase family protein [Chthoniobacteraceae bacterium]